MKNNYENYDDRPNKRRALNDILRTVQKEINHEFIYITLSSSEILDVNDILKVVKKGQITKILAYEKDQERAREAENSEIAKIFEGRIKIINEVFPNYLSEELEDFEEIQKVVFFDGVEWFCNKKGYDTRSEFQDLLKTRVLGHNDIYIISSSVAHRSWHTVEDEVLKYYQYYYSNNKCKYVTGSDEFIEKLKENTVDLNVEVAIRNCNSDRVKIGSKKRITAERLGKIRYNDTNHTEMDLLGFRFVETTDFPKALDIPCSYDNTYRGTKKFDDILDKIING